MFLKKNPLFLLVLVQYCLGDDLYIDQTSEDCDDNGTTFGDTFVTTSVKIYLLTPSNESIELNSTNLNLVNSSQPTKILVHGLGAYESTTWIDEMATIYHTKGGYNIIAIDWSLISVQDQLYLGTAVNAVGEVVGTFIMDITQTSVENLKDVHLIGSSVGAQVGGAAGEVVAKNGTKIGRITGLDPTVPENLEILDEDDADFVDVIHTSVVFGESRCGTVDFYVFGDDPEHPVCFNDTCGNVLANDFYMLTIEEGQRFEGISCYNASSYVRHLCEKADGIFMGEYVPRNVTGSYLVSKDAAPEFHGQSKYVLSCTFALVLWYFLQ